MQAIPALSGPVREPAGSARRLVVFLHGLGADGNDLIGLADQWADALPDTVFASPDAHQPCDMAPTGRQWFSLIDRDPAAMAAGAETALPVLNAYLDGLIAQYDLDDAAMALVGFSQGGMMALQAGLRRPDPCAGIAAYSSALVGADRLAGQIRARPPVMLVHGDADQVVEPTALDHSIRALAGLGIEAESHLRPGLGHGIDAQGIALGRDFLARVLGGVRGYN
ncbi:MAG: dienelactone hydrolase family protein [Alphaproteobacteria bacterium]|nr:dienelactone hydrolase family protein [Alphaproteobacteria bacterium]